MERRERAGGGGGLGRTTDGRRGRERESARRIKAVTTLLGLWPGGGEQGADAMLRLAEATARVVEAAGR